VVVRAGSGQVPATVVAASVLGVVVSAIGTVQRVVDERAAAVAGWADPPVVEVWADLGRVTAGDPPPMGLLAGERPAADVEVLASLVAAAEFELARRMVLAAAAGGLPLVGAGGMLRARGWSAAAARRLVSAGQIAVEFPEVGAQWAAGVIAAEHAAAIDRARGQLTDLELSVALRGFDGRWGALSPHAVGQVITAIETRLHPPADPSPDEAAAYAARHLDFALTADEVLFSGTLPRLEGEAFLAVIEAFAETLRSTADHVPPAARRADALTALVQAAAASGQVPTRGGLPVALTVTLTPTTEGDLLAATSRGHRLTDAETRFTCCDPTVTPILTMPGSEPGTTLTRDEPGDPAVARILAIAAALLDAPQPLAVGRTARLATPAQRRALAVRDRGCIIPGCGVPADICQVHHLSDWAQGGTTDLDNMTLLCWTHHRQVDLHMWTITTRQHHNPPPTPEPGAPPDTPWPANNGAPWTITRTPRTRWRL
jgi:hypothetical protein